MEHLLKLAFYNDWANRVLFAAFQQSETAIPAFSLRLLSHIVNAQAIWLSRIKGENVLLKTWDEHPVETCAAIHEQSNAIFQNQEELMPILKKMISYTNFQGQAYQTSVEDILIHVFNHGTYHRSQIAQDMRQNGLTPVNTDYIFYIRQLPIVFPSGISSSV